MTSEDFIAQIIAVKEDSSEKGKGWLLGIKETLAEVEKIVYRGCGLVIPVVENKVMIKTILCGRDEWCPSCHHYMREIAKLREEVK